jgi:hypothetical protein
MLEFLEGSCDISGHRQCDCSLDIIPFKADATVECAIPVCGDGIRFRQALDQMFSMFLSDIFDTKIIDNQGEGDGTGVMLP